MDPFRVVIEMEFVVIVYIFDPPNLGSFDALSSLSIANNASDQDKEGLSFSSDGVSSKDGRGCCSCSSR